jgi:uncharacterized membrane protein YedE/YeeE
MEWNPHLVVLAMVFAIAAVVGAVANKTGFCTMGAVSDWVNMGDTGRMRSWLLAMAVAMLGVAALDLAGMRLGSDTFPPYRTANFAWLRYIVGGLLFGVGMTLGSGCGNKTLVRLGGGNLKSLVVLAVAAIGSYLMLWTGFYSAAFEVWIAPTTLDLRTFGVPSQALGDIIAGREGGATANAATGVFAGLAIAAFALSSREFRSSFDNVMGGAVVGFAVVAGWAITAGSLGEAWKEFAAMTSTPPSRVATQSYTFISPMGDMVRYLAAPAHFELVNFGIAALLGVIAGSFIWSLATRSVRIEWFRSPSDAVSHVAGGALMGIGGVLGMGCTIGQGVTGISTLAMGSVLAVASIVAGAAATMKFQYWRMMREA